MYYAATAAAPAIFAIGNKDFSAETINIAAGSPAMPANAFFVRKTVANSISPMFLSSIIFNVTAGNLTFTKNPDNTWDITQSVDNIIGAITMAATKPKLFFIDN
jgi:hypothetical protein